MDGFKNSVDLSRVRQDFHSGPKSSASAVRYSFFRDGMTEDLGHFGGICVLKLNRACVFDPGASGKPILEPYLMILSNFHFLQTDNFTKNLQNRYFSRFPSNLAIEIGSGRSNYVYKSTMMAKTYPK